MIHFYHSYQLTKYSHKYHPYETKIVIILIILKKKKQVLRSVWDIWKAVE